VTGEVRRAQVFFETEAAIDDPHRRIVEVFGDTLRRPEEFHACRRSHENHFIRATLAAFLTA